MATNDKSLVKPSGPGSGSRDHLEQTLVPRIPLSTERVNDVALTQAVTLITSLCEGLNWLFGVVTFKKPQQDDSESHLNTQSEPVPAIDAMADDGAEDSANIRDVGGLNINYEAPAMGEGVHAQGISFRELASLRPGISSRAGKHTKNSANIDGCGGVTITYKVGAGDSAGSAGKK